MATKRGGQEGRRAFLGQQGRSGSETAERRSCTRQEHPPRPLPPSLPPSPSIQAVFKNHQLTNKADFWSLHSWLGLAVILLFLLNYLGAFLAFFLRLAPQPLRASVLPYHVLLGVSLYLAAVFTAQTGGGRGEGGREGGRETVRAL